MNRLFQPSILFTLLAALVFKLAVSSPAAGAPDVTIESAALKQALADIEEHIADLRSIRSDFRQTKKLAVFDREMVITGEMAMEEPGRMAWRVDKPVKYTMVIKDGQMTHWDEDTDSINRMSMDDEPMFQSVFEQLTTWFSGRYENFIEEYEIEIVQTNPYVLLFTPRPESMFAEIMEKVKVTFRRDTRYIEKLSLVETNGDRTIIEFINPHLNIDLDQETWEVRSRAR